MGQLGAVLLRMRTVGSAHENRCTVSRTSETGILWCRFRVKEEIPFELRYSAHHFRQLIVQVPRYRKGGVGQIAPITLSSGGQVKEHGGES